MTLARQTGNFITVPLEEHQIVMRLSEQIEIFTWGLP